MKCNHKWKMIDKTIFDSPFRQALQKQCTEVEGTSSPDMLKDRVIFVFQCEECSETKIEER